MTILIAMAAVAVLAIVWPWFRRIVLIYAAAVAFGYAAVSWWLYQHPEHTGSQTAPTTEEATTP